MILSIFEYLHGSTPDDFDQAVESSPFEQCPDSPNCTYHSVLFSIDPELLFEHAEEVIEHLSPHKYHSDSQSLQIDAVFRIPVFGFKDDLKIRIHPNDLGGSIFHIKSSSRVGESDLGVNRRRINKVLSQLHQQI